MRRNSLFFSLACMTILALAGWSSPLKAEQPARVLFDFDGSDSLDQWRTVNDGVMGGVSDGRRRIADQGSMEFFGKLSLENNGGFASVRSQASELRLSDGDVIVARVRGDGRRYYLNMRTNAPRMAFSYRADFQTEADQWQEIRIPVRDFRANWFGRKVPGAALDPASVNSIGFLLADKIPGPFQLQVDWIKVVRDDSI
jgi:NADH dehydrogenase [ubiquinone] 1 alpha subcomplex assembly factor 1